MGDILEFPRVPDPEPKDAEISADEFARYAALLQDGHSEDEAMDIIVVTRRIRNASRDCI